MKDNTSTTNNPILPRVIDDPKEKNNVKAILTGPKRKAYNPTGKNQFSFEKSLTPYSLKYALADVLLKQGKTIKQVCLYTSLSTQTVWKIKKGLIRLSDQWIKAIKDNEANKHTFLSNMILDSINPTDMEKASLLQKVTSSSILIDKRRLISGESTQNVSYLDGMANLASVAKDLNSAIAKMDVIEGETVKDTAPSQNAIESKKTDNQQLESDISSPKPPLEVEHNIDYQNQPNETR